MTRQELLTAIAQLPPGERVQLLHDVRQTLPELERMQYDLDQVMNDDQSWCHRLFEAMLRRWLMALDDRDNQRLTAKDQEALALLRERKRRGWTGEDKLTWLEIGKAMGFTVAKQGSEDGIIRAARHRVESALAKLPGVSIIGPD
jgi:hypothetical protein